MWSGHQNRKKKHISNGNGFGFSIFNENSAYTNTISARYYKDGSEALIEQKDKNPRVLTPRECARLQGFSDDFKITVSDRRAWEQFGNSVAVPVIRAIAKKLEKHLLQPKIQQKHEVLDLPKLITNLVDTTSYSQVALKLQ